MDYKVELVLFILTHGSGTKNNIFCDVSVVKLLSLHVTGAKLLEQCLISMLSDDTTMLRGQGIFF